MIHNLTTPVRGASHINVTRGIKDEAGNAITLEGTFGSLSEGDFQPDAELAPYARTISQWEVEEAFKPFAAARGNLLGDTRMSDVIAFWDEHGLWDRSNVVPGLAGGEE
jgi:hypothetical protein